MPKIEIYTKENCPYCAMAKQLLSGRNLAFTEVRIDLDASKQAEMIERSMKRTVPQIFINNKSIGGYDDLAELVKLGKLNDLLIDVQKK